jgi:hypothetical protein
MSFSTSINIHDAASVEYKRVQFSNFWTHRLTIKTKDGKKHEIDVFAYSPLELNVRPNELAHECKPMPVDPSEVATA